MGRQQAHKADQTGQAHHGRDDQRRNQQHDQSEQAHMDAQHSRFPFLRRKKDQLAMQCEQRRHAECAEQQISGDGMGADAV